MKKFIVIPLLFMLLNAFTIMDSHLDNLVQILSRGEVSKLTTMLDHRVKVTIENKRASMEKVEAVTTLMDFFTKNPVKKFNLIHQVNGNHATLLVGDLITTAAHFRTTLYVMEDEGTLKIQEIRFE